MIKTLDQIIDSITEAITGVFKPTDTKDNGFYKDYLEKTPKEIEDEKQGYLKSL